MRLLVVLVITLLVVPFTYAGKKSSRKTNFEFTEANVKGRYNSSGEGLSVVEDEKSILDVLAIRKNFKDRVKNNLKVQR